VTSSRIGETLRAARVRLGWSREALAYHAGMSWAAIAQIESGRRQNVQLSSLTALATALSVSVDYLIGAGPISPPLLEHLVLAYRSEDELLDMAVPFLAQGIERSEPALAVTSEAHIELLRVSLGSDAGHVVFADSVGWLTSPNAALDRYRAWVKQEIDAGASWVRILGEPIWAGRSDAEVVAWTRFESLFNLAFASSPISVVCPYDTRALIADVVANAFRTHPVIAHGTDVAGNPEYREAEQFLLSG
jgi:transcriptional regulator with XRE-family HTH domain